MQSSTYVLNPYYSDGSSQLYPECFPRPYSTDYRYHVVERGELDSRLCPSGLLDSTLHATGIGFSGNQPSTSSYVPPEHMSYYPPLHSSWDHWEDSDTGPQQIVAPAPVYPPAFSESAASRSHQEECVYGGQLPTPAAMAAFLAPSGRSEREPTQPSFELPPGPSVAISRQPPASASRSGLNSVEPATTVQPAADGQAREKRHACTMCHKR